MRGFSTCQQSRMWPDFVLHLMPKLQNLRKVFAKNLLVPHTDFTSTLTTSGLTSCQASQFRTLVLQIAIFLNTSQLCFSYIYIFQVVNDDCLLYSFWPSPLFNSAWGVFLFVITFLVPLIILIYCYGRIVWVLTGRIDSKLGGLAAKNDKFEIARTNTIKTLLLVALCFVICWSSNQVYYLTYNIGFKADWNSTFYQFTVVMVFINCTINPFIYLAKYQDFQTALKSFCVCRKSVHGRHTELSSVQASLSVVGTTYHKT